MFDRSDDVVSARPAGDRLPAERSGVPAIAVIGVLGVGIAVVVGLLAWVLGPSGGPTATARSDAAPARSGAVPGQGHAFWARNPDGSPVRWNPCQEIRWVLNPAGAPSSARDDVAAAAARIADATGLAFSFAGTTDEEPARDRAPYQPQRYGDRWAPVLVGWQTPSGTDLPLRDADRGVAVPVALDAGTNTTFITAQVVLNAERDLASGFAERAETWGATILHELGHVAGLDHVADEGALMYAYPGSGPVTFAPGDLAGLARLGADQGCLPTPDPSHVTVEYVTDFGR